MRTGWRGRTAGCAGLLAGLGGGTPAERRGRNLPGDSPEAELVADRPSTIVVEHRDYAGAADKAVNLVGCKSPHHQLPETE